MERCLFPTGVGTFYIKVVIIKALLPNFALTWQEDRYVSRQGRNMNRRNKSTTTLIVVDVDILNLNCLLFIES